MPAVHLRQTVSAGCEQKLPSDEPTAERFTACRICLVFCRMQRRRTAHAISCGYSPSDAAEGMENVSLT